MRHSDSHGCLRSVLTRPIWLEVAMRLAEGQFPLAKRSFRGGVVRRWRRARVRRNTLGASPELERLRVPPSRWNPGSGPAVDRGVLAVVRSTWRREPVAPPRMALGSALLARRAVRYGTLRPARHRAAMPHRSTRQLAACGGSRGDHVTEVPARGEPHHNGSDVLDERLSHGISRAATYRCSEGRRQFG